MANPPNPAGNVILLNRFEFCHVRNKNTGDILLHEGEPKHGKRLQLESHEEIVGVWEKIRVPDSKYATILNPFNEASGDIIPGDREIRPGPAEFSLHPGEAVESIDDEIVLADDEGLLLRADKDSPHPLAGEAPFPADAVLHAGQEVLIKGERRYVPHKHIRIKEQRKSIPLSAENGKYVQNSDTGEVRLVRGECDLFLEHNESLWNKHLTREELQALGYEEQVAPDNTRVLVAEPRPRKNGSDAIVIDLEANEAIAVYTGNAERVVFGPDTVFLEPHERPKVLFISGGVPVRPNALRIAILKLGPDFIRDRLTVRTKDNATLAIDVNFRWRFQADRENPDKLFALKDFVGFVAQTLSSEIREETAKHTFEDFHSKAAELVKKTLFNAEESRVFTENGMEIFGIDVEGIVPEDPEIKQKLADAIKTNVDIYTQRVKEEAELESERRLIDGRAKNEKARRALISLEIANNRTQTIGQAKIQGEAAIASAQSKATAVQIQTKAEREAEVERLKNITAVLAGSGGKSYIDLERARVLKATDKVVVPTDSKLFLGLDSVLDA